MPKPRADAKLLNLPPEDHEWLVSLLFSAGMSYDRAKPIIREKLGVRCSSSALSSFWEQCCAPRLLQRRGQSAAAAQAIAADAEQNGGTFTAATVAMLRQKAFDLLVDSNANPDDVRGLLALALKARDQDAKTEELKIKQRLATVAEMKIGELLLKAANDARAQEIAGLSCSNEEKIRLLRQHYFSDVEALEQSGAVKLPPQA